MVLAFSPPFRYAITNLSSSPSDAPADRRVRLQTALRRWAVDGVDTVQLREKALNTAELFALATAAMQILRRLPDDEILANTPRPSLLINSRLDVALAAGADGVHLPGGPGALTPAQIRSAFARAGRPHCLVSLSCHTLDEVANAGRGGADLILFGPVFEKIVDGRVVVAGQGLPLLRQACLAAGTVPVLALGGVTPQHLDTCLRAGAAGFASIRAFG